MTEEHPGSPSISAPLEVTILMPCLNEAETLGACVSKAVQALADNGLVGEVLVADNGSTDGSQALAESLGARVEHVAQKGYGAALLGGINAARGRFVVMADSDDSYEFGHVARFVEPLRAGADLVMGNRFLGGIQKGAMPPLHRYLGNPVLSGIGRLFFKTPVGDFHCGLRGFRRTLAQELDLRTTGMEFASEMVVKASLAKLRIVEVPTILKPDGRSRPPHLRSFRDGWRHLRFMLLHSPRWLFFYPGLALMLLGLALMVWLQPGPRTVGGVTFDVHTLLYGVAMLIIGVQATLMALCTRTFSVGAHLSPPGTRWNTWAQNLEFGLLLGLVLFLAGGIGSVASILSWRSHDYGNLVSGELLRLVIPSVAGMIVGCQIALGSFFLSVLALERR